MKKYHVTYFLMVQGMHEPDRADFGIINAKSPEEAKQIVCNIKYPADVADKATRDYFAGCLSVEEVKES